ncbi:hypothetical protein [Pedobacter sp. UC225_65]|uniref:hypothetical protein n=1 Tax=Pedobacter sp. UC225_65 TaxID=3350173 RepID=UPI00366D66BC
MKKANLLSKTELKKVMGGTKPNCPEGTCAMVMPGSNWDDLCPMNMHCETFLCDDGVGQYTKCVPDGVTLPEL